MGPTQIGGPDLSLLNLPEEESLIEHGGESGKGSAYPTRPCERAFPERVLSVGSMSAALAVDGSVGVGSLGCSPRLSPLQASRGWAVGAEAEAHKRVPCPSTPRHSWP